MTLEIANSVIEAIAILKSKRGEVATAQPIWDKVYNAHRHLEKELERYLSGE